MQGIGGLGHLGIQSAKKFGYRVAAAGLQKLGGALVILATAPIGKAMSALIGGLGVNGTMVVVGASADPIEVPSNQLFLGKKGIQG